MASTRVMHSLLILIAPLVLLSSCSYSYEVTARYDGDRLILDSKAGGWLSPDPCIHGNFTVKDGQVTMWAIEERQHDCPRGGDFPLIYGVSPTGFDASVPAKKLKPGQIYTIEGGLGVRYYGRFRKITRTIYEAVNLPVR